ncbi:MAG: hypothetical protein ACE5KT_03995 [Methanosarcinales archaeon]
MKNLEVKNTETKNTPSPFKYAMYGAISCIVLLVTTLFLHLSGVF